MAYDVSAGENWRVHCPSQGNRWARVCAKWPFGFRKQATGIARAGGMLFKDSGRWLCLHFVFTEEEIMLLCRMNNNILIVTI